MVIVRGDSLEEAKFLFLFLFLPNQKLPYLSWHKKRMCSGDT